MAEVEIVETSLARRQSVPLGGARHRHREDAHDSARDGSRRLSSAIDFTTSTHMGVAVRYKREDPWERIRLMAAATPNTPLQFMSTGFRFIGWETASPEFMALAFRTLARNGIRRFCLADPMNDADANIACARMVKDGGGEYVDRRARVHAEPGPRRCALRGARPQTRRLPRHRCALHQGSRRAAVAEAREHADPGDQGADRRQAARSCTPTAPSDYAELLYMDAPDYGVSALQCASGAAADGISNPPADGSCRIFARSATTYGSTTPHSRK